MSCNNNRMMSYNNQAGGAWNATQSTWNGQQPAYGNAPQTVPQQQPAWTDPQPASPPQQQGPWTTPVLPDASQDTSWIPETMLHPIYTPGFLIQNIGSLVRVEFLIGGYTTDRVGVLTEVGASFIVLKSLEGSSRIMCDLFSIKFVTIISPAETNELLHSFNGSDASILMAGAGQN